MTIQQRDYDPALMQGAANTVALPQTVTAATSSAFAVGANGATNPVIQIDASTSSVATGVKITGAATGTAAAIAAIGSATDEFLSISGKGAGTVKLVGQVSSVLSGQGATKTLTAADSGTLCLFDRAAGIVYTLPAPTVGLFFDFYISTTITSGAAKVITNTGTVLLTGITYSVATDNTNAVAAYVGNGSTHISVSMNGTTTGGVKGAWFHFECLTSTLWSVQGVSPATSTVATPFSTS